MIAACMGPGVAATDPSSIHPVAAPSIAHAITALSFMLLSGHPEQPLRCRGVFGPFTPLQKLEYCVSEHCARCARDCGCAQWAYLDLLQGDPLPALQLLVLNQAAAAPASVQRIFSLATS